MKIFDDISEDTPKPGDQWQHMSNAERVSAVKKILHANTHESELTLSSCEPDGYIFVSFLKTISADKRGMMLMDLEWALKQDLDQALTVWHVPQGDKSSLRRLRGVEVKVI
jgi:hypothetical protein